VRTASADTAETLVALAEHVMATASAQEITVLLKAWSGGDKTALDELTRLCYEELRRIARRHLRRAHPGHTLQASALVNEAYHRLSAFENFDWQNRAHFFAMSARIMRNILVDLARRRARTKRGAGALAVSLSEAAHVAEPRSADLIALDEALDALAVLGPRKASVVELKFFGGLTNDEAAAVLEVSSDTVRRDWRSAQAWLFRELTRGSRHDA
jgi:RNA polymerase sigma-70 factor (ECF subfamily)